MPKNDDAVFRYHYTGDKRATEPKSSFLLEKVACSDPNHSSCGDCLKHMWNHAKIINAKRPSECMLCRAMQLTIRMRRNTQTEESFAEFEQIMGDHIDYIARVVDARHLNSFSINYAKHSKSASERACAAIAIMHNTAEKSAVSVPPSQGVLQKNTDRPGIADATFTLDGCYDSCFTNFTMYDWKRGDAIGKHIEVILDVLSPHAVVKKLVAACLAWSIIYKNTNFGRLAKHGSEAKWKKDVFDAYLS